MRFLPHTEQERRDMGILTINEDGTWNEESPNLSAN